MSTAPRLPLGLWPSLWQRQDVLHGVFTTAGLRSQGLTDRARDQLLAAGRLRRIQRGWFATALANRDAVRAVQLGGRLGCVSGCRAHGVWTPPDPRLHVMLNPGVDVPPHAPGTVFHRLSRGSHQAVAPLEDCLVHVIHRHDPETALVVVESAVNLGLLHEADARALLRAAPVRRQRGLQHFTPGAQSGSETRVRVFFQRRNVPVASQVLIPGVGRVDLLVGRSLIVEADSQAHHSQPRNVTIDRERDLVSRQLGYRSLRLSYPQIWHTWPRTQQVLAAELRGRHHRRPPRPL